MNHDQSTTVVVQRHLDDLGHLPDGAPAEPLVRELLASAADRLRLLCASLLYRSYPRLTHPPLNLHADEMLGAVVERMIKAMRHVRPHNVRQFFALASRHMRWELNDLARRLDSHEVPLALRDSFPAAAPPESENSQLTLNARRMLEAIEALPEREREVFTLVRIQGLAQADAAPILAVSVKTVRRRLTRGLILLAQQLGDLQPTSPAPARQHEHA